MAQIAYRDVTFRPAALRVIEQANEIASAYQASGDSLTLRQLYYRFVAAGLIPNRDQEYKRLGAIINDARYAGLFDWDYITDRTRNVRGGDGADTDPRLVVEDLSFYAAMWEGQPERVEVWVEKDALVDVVGRACGPLRTPYFSCRGYTSASEVHVAAERIEGYFDDGAEHVTILHLGDHDPSGIDMTRDITERLEPGVLRQLIDEQVRALIDPDRWAERREFETDGRATLRAFSTQYDRIHAFLDAEGLLPKAEDDE